MDTAHCSACGQEAAAGDKFCSACGFPLAGPAGRPAAQAPAPKWYHNVWFVLAMLFFVLGPFGLPLVWQNPRLSMGMKIGLTLITLVYTAWLIELTLKMMQSVTGHLQQFQQTLPAY